MRRVNEMFHVDDEGRLVKTSNNQPVPEDEPVFILRGRDNLSVPTLIHYHKMMGVWTWTRNVRRQLRLSSSNSLNSLTITQTA